VKKQQTTVVFHKMLHENSYNPLKANLKGYIIRTGQYI